MNRRNTRSRKNRRQTRKNMRGGAVSIPITFTCSDYDPKRPAVTFTPTKVSASGSVNVNGNFNATNIFNNGTLINFNSYAIQTEVDAKFLLYPTLIHLSNTYLTISNFNSNIADYTKTGLDLNYLNVNSGGNVNGTTTFLNLNSSNLNSSNLNVNNNLTVLNTIASSNIISSNINANNIRTSNIISSNITANNINTSNINASNLYINDSIINFNSYWVYRSC